MSEIKVGAAVVDKIPLNQPTPILDRSCSCGGREKWVGVTVGEWVDNTERMFLCWFQLQVMVTA